MIHENKTESKVGSCRVGDHNASNQIGLNPGPVGPGYVLPLQIVCRSRSAGFQKPTDLKLHYFHSVYEFRSIV